jgi:hypothetical protein
VDQARVGTWPAWIRVLVFLVVWAVLTIAILAALGPVAAGIGGVEVGVVTLLSGVLTYLLLASRLRARTRAR